MGAQVWRCFVDALEVEEKGEVERVCVTVGLGLGIGKGIGVLGIQ